MLIWFLWIPISSLWNENCTCISLRSNTTPGAFLSEFEYQEMSYFIHVQALAWLMLCLQQKMALRYRAIHNKWGCPLGLLRFCLEPSLGPWLRSVFGDSFFGDVLSLWWMIKICMSPQPNSWCCRGDGGMLWNHAYVFNHQVSSSCLIVKSSCIIHKWAMFQTVKYPEGESSTPSSSPQWLQSIPLPVDDYTNYTGRGVILPSKNAFEHCSLSLETMCFFFFFGGLSS